MDVHLSLSLGNADLLAAAGAGKDFVGLSAGKGFHPAIVLGHHLVVNDHVLHIFLISLIDILRKHTEIGQDQQERGSPVDYPGLEEDSQDYQNNNHNHHGSGQLVHSISSVHKTCNFLFQIQFLPDMQLFLQAYPESILRRIC